MKKSAYLDKECIEKIFKNIDRIKLAFEHFEINSLSDFESCDLAQLAITQAITNIHETKKHMREETLIKLWEFDKIKLTNARNIASHDYESLNFETLYRIVTRLLDEKISEVLSNEYNNL